MSEDLFQTLNSRLPAPLSNEYDIEGKMHTSPTAEHVHSFHDIKEEAISVKEEPIDYETIDFETESSAMDSNFDKVSEENEPEDMPALAEEPDTIEKSELPTKKRRKRRSPRFVETKGKKKKSNVDQPSPSFSNSAEPLMKECSSVHVEGEANFEVKLNLTDTEKIEQCVVYLNSIDIPIYLIGYITNYIYETFAAKRLHIDISANTIKDIVEREKISANTIKNMVEREKNTDQSSKPYFIYSSACKNPAVGYSDDPLAPLSKKSQYRDEWMIDKSRQCVAYLHSIGLPLPRIQYTINFIWETLTGCKLDFNLPETTLQIILDNEKKDKPNARRRAKASSRTGPSSSAIAINVQPLPSIYTNAIAVEGEGEVEGDQEGGD